MTSPTSWQARVRARMREEIDEWVEEGRLEEPSDRPLVLLDAGVVAGPAEPSEGIEEEPADRLHVPDYMPGLVEHLMEVADVVWTVAQDDERLHQLAGHLEVGPLRAVGTDDFGMVESAVRARLWRAASAGRPTYRIEHFGGEVPPRLPDKTVLIDTAPEATLRPHHLPAELRPPD